MTVTGLESDLYLIENPIYVEIADLSVNTSYVDVFVTNLSTQEASEPQRLYYIGQDIIIDISGLVKSFMNEPKHNTEYANPNPMEIPNNLIKLKVSFRRVNSTNSSITISRERTFIRGGNKVYAFQNQTASIGYTLQSSDKIPVWNTYPVASYYLGNEKKIFKSIFIPSNLKDERRVKGCNPLYFKFLNSKGGYSYWLFENSEEESRSRNIGSINRQNEIVDLGNETEFKITAISKVPVMYYELIEDLIFSQEIYIYRGVNNWERVSSDNNTIKKNPYDVNVKVSLKFKPYYRYNPSLLW